MTVVAGCLSAVFHVIMVGPVATQARARNIFLSAPVCVVFVRARARNDQRTWQVRTAMARNSETPKLQKNAPWAGVLRLLQRRRR